MSALSLSVPRETTNTRQRQAREARRPDFIVRAPDPHRRGRWITLGAAWKRDDGGFNCKLQTVPVGGAWDGALVLLPPLPDSDQDNMDFNQEAD